MRDRIHIGLLLLVVAVIYLVSLPPSMLWVDSGTMLAASKILGIPNPPGFPFYVFVTHYISQMIPFGSHIFRMEMISVIAAITLLFFTFQSILLLLEHNYLTVKKKEPRKIALHAGFFGTIALAFSYQFWSQSQNTEAFIFTYALVAIVNFLLLRIMIATINKRVFQYLFIIAILMGCGAGANPTVAAIVPAILFVMVVKRGSLSVIKVGLLGLVFLLAIAITYSYLPIRASAWPFVNWGNPQTVQLFLDHLHGKGLNIYEPETGSINGFTGSPLVFVQSVGYFFLMALIQFTPLLFPLIIFGVRQVFKRSKFVASYLMIVPLFICIYGAIYYSGNQESWFILAWIFLAIFLAIGYYELVRIPRFTKYSQMLLLASLIPLLCFSFILNRSTHHYSSDYLDNMYSHVEKDAILLGSGDFFSSASNYMRVDSTRMDVTPITVNIFYVNKWGRDNVRHASNISVSNKHEEIIQYKSFSEFNNSMNQLIAENIDRHPIYVQHLSLRASALAATSGGQLQLDKRFKFVPNGLTLKIVRSEQNVKPDMDSFNYKFRSPLSKNPIYLERNYKAAYINILNDYAYGYAALADWYFDNKDDKNGLLYLKKAHTLTPQNAEILGKMGTYYSLKNDHNAAYQFYIKGLQFDPKNIGLHFNLGLAFGHLGKIDKAIDEFKAVLAYAPYGDLITLDAQKMIESLVLQKGSTDPNAWQTKVDQDQRVLISIPPTMVATKEGDVLSIESRDRKFSIQIYGQEMKQGQTTQDFLDASPIQFEGQIVEASRTNIPGYDFSYAEVFQDEKGSKSQRIVLVQDPWMWVFKIYPQENADLPVINEIMNTFKPYDE